MIQKNFVIVSCSTDWQRKNVIIFAYCSCLVRLGKISNWGHFSHFIHDEILMPILREEVGLLSAQRDSVR